SPTGYGGGIFLTGSGDYDPSTKRLDLKGMKISGNTANNSGQSLYVAMSKVKEWCQTGILGEFAKGNYSDGISNMNELQGILIDSTTFNSYSSAQINYQQNYLEDYWNVNRDIFYIKDSGSNGWQCTSSNPCKTLDASTATPRTFRNYPLDSTQLSSILIKANGGFNINGKVRFQLINFIMENPSLQQDIENPILYLDTDSTGVQSQQHGIYGLSLSAEIDLQNCQFYMQNIGQQIRKCFIYLEKGGNHAISNLIVKDISSEENSIKIDFSYAGSIIISDSQFENITKIGNNVEGGAVRTELKYSSNRLDIKDCKFSVCKARNTFGGAINAKISDTNAQITLSRTQFLQCDAQSGGGLYAIIDKGSFVIENSCIFKECNAIAGNGGGIYLNLEFGLTNQTSFIIRDALIQNCQAVSSASSSSDSTGFGGGIFIGEQGYAVPPLMSLDLKGMKIYGNSASSGGQSLYVVMDKLQQWCEYGLLGEYVKGNYSDTDSDENDLQGLPIDFSQFASQSKSSIQTNQKTLENYWGIKIPSYSIWHVQQRFGSQNGTDQLNCGQTNQPCKTIEYAIQQISVNVGGYETIFIEVKNIGISQYGYDLTSPIQLSKSGSHTDVIKIMKQMYGTGTEMLGNAEMK
ncbi:MAG: hypothetical protein EZS28_039458, partial [Streblomastix strix]